MDVMVYDETASYDTFRITSAEGDVLRLQHTMPDTPQSYATGAKIVAAASHTFYRRVDDDTATYQLMHYDGVRSDAALVDHVVGLAFDYLGEALPPGVLRPFTEPIGPWTTYGPRPPPPDQRPTAYPAGENCVFQIDGTGTGYAPRLAVLGGAATLVRLNPSQLTDGPWCPDATNPHRYDADLLRIRSIGVTIRIESALTALRGPAGILFAHGGSSTDAGRWVPDRELRLDITPRNLNGR
jgi:hypothetical protein